MQDTLKKTRVQMDAAIEHLKRELAKIRTGRASTNLLDDLMVSYYGTPTPVSQVATLAVPEPRMITITPWEENLVPAIEKAIMTSDLGINPSSDGKMIRVPIPPLTEERRKDFVKQAHKVSEEGRISTRNARRDAVDAFKRMQKDGDISEDDSKRGQDQVQKLTDEFGKQIDEILKRKDAEITDI
jgi:ribosome recycling factor